MAKTKSKKGSVLNIVEGIIIGLMIILIAVMLTMCFSFNKNGSTPNFFGYTFYHTMAVNMAPEIPAGTAVIAKASEIENIKVGSVVLCTIGEDTVLTRVVQLVNENNTMSYVVKFDTASPNDTFKIPKENITAKAVQQSKILGSLLSFATSTFGIMLVIIIPSFIIIVFQIIRIINVKRTEEEASSLDDLDEIMLDTDGRFEDMFGSENNAPETKSNHKNETDADEYAAPLMPMSFGTQEQKPEVLSVDKNGKAGLSAAAEKNSPLFTYDNAEFRREYGRNAAKQRKAVVKPITTPNTDEFYSNYVENTERDPIYGDRIKQQEIVEEASDAQTQIDNKQENTDTAPAFMSNVIPEPIAVAVSVAEKAETVGESVKKYAPKPVYEDKVIRKSQSIPKQAALPKEKLAPPIKKNTSKAISELMSIIDAEENKLHK